MNRCGRIFSVGQACFRTGRVGIYHRGTNSKTVGVGLHQGSALSPCLFLILMDALTEGVRKEVPESMMLADDIVLCVGRK